MYDTAVHLDWQQRVEDLKKVRGEKLVEEELYPNATTKIRKHRRSKTLWVRKQALLDAGYRNLQTFQIVRINDQHYEIQGFDSKKQEYWIEEIKETFDKKDIYSQLQRS